MEQRESTGARKNNNVNIHGWEICLQNEGKIKGQLLGAVGKILVVDVITGNNPNVHPLGTGRMYTTGHMQLQSNDRGTETRAEEERFLWTAVFHLIHEERVILEHQRFAAITVK